MQIQANWFLNSASSFFVLKWKHQLFGYREIEGYGQNRIYRTWGHGRTYGSNLLRKGFEVTVYNRTPGKANKLIELGANEAAEPAAVAKTSEIIITMISNDDAIRGVYYGKDGILCALMPGSVIIDSSTISPYAT